MNTNRLDLVDQWLEYFGVAVAHELDLGTLTVIKKLIDEGRTPAVRANLSADVPTTPHQGQTS